MSADEDASAVAASIDRERRSNSDGRHLLLAPPRRTLSLVGAFKRRGCPNPLSAQALVAEWVLGLLILRHLRTSLSWTAEAPVPI